MGDGADDLYEREMYAVENTKFCPVHRHFYVDYDFGCPSCEEGEPPNTSPEGQGEVSDD